MFSLKRCWSSYTTLILQLMIIALQMKTPAWKAVIPTTHLTCSPPLRRSQPSHLLTPTFTLGFLAQGGQPVKRMTTAGDRGEKSEDWVQGALGEVVTGESEEQGPAAEAGPWPYYTGCWQGPLPCRVLLAGTHPFCSSEASQERSKGSSDAI